VALACLLGLAGASAPARPGGHPSRSKPQAGTTPGKTGSKTGSKTASKTASKKTATKTTTRTATKTETTTAKGSASKQPGKGAAAKASSSASPKAKTRGAEASTWLFQKPANVVPNQQGKVVLFTFRNDDGDAISRQVGQLLGSRGLDVMTGVQRVDTSEQFRDVATHLGLVAYVDGDVRGSDAKTKVIVRLRNGYTGRNVSQASFTESRPNLSREISDKLWTRLGPAMARACKDAEKPRKKSRALQINAGTPIETVPNKKAEDGT
jgi:hypothetical protein